MGQDHIVIMGNPGMNKTIRTLRQFCGPAVRAAPFLPNPFQIVTANCTFLKNVGKEWN
jgi:hypothetical protein